MATTDTLTPLFPPDNEIPADWQVVPFTSGGTHEVLVADTLTGATSSATCVVVLIELTSGTWAGGDAAGFFVVKTVSGTFVAENLNEGANGNVCTIAAAPAVAAASGGARNGHQNLAFDDTAVELAVFKGIMPSHYDGGGVTVKLNVAAATDTTNNLVFSCALERIGQVLDLDTDSWGPLVDSSATAVSGTAGTPVQVTVALSSGANMDSTVVGESFRLMVVRRSDLAGDTVVGDAHLESLELLET